MIYGRKDFSFIKLCTLHFFVVGFKKTHVGVWVHTKWMCTCQTGVSISLENFVSGKIFFLTIKYVLKSHFCKTGLQTIHGQTIKMLLLAKKSGLLNFQILNFGDLEKMCLLTHRKLAGVMHVLIGQLSLFSLMFHSYIP